MFEESLLESSALLQTRSRWPAVASVAAQGALATLIVAVPLFHPELLPMQARSFSLTPPPPPAPPRPIPPPQPVHVALVSAEVLSVPAAPAATRPLLHTLIPVAPSTVDTPIASTIGPGMPGTSTSALANTLVPGTSPNVTAAPAVSQAPARPSRVNLSSGVTAGMLLAPIEPAYPSIAKAAGQQGAVVVRAVISRGGLIERAQVVSGPAMLQNAALDAVEHARYRPYLLNGQPTEVETTITIHFRLGGGA